jgi:2,5-diamino-6-(ribosylamino)-4(3H)-pyrimidinone 5'-phosphate reductase
MLPRVILHNAVSLDGRIDDFAVDLAQFYELTTRWKEDASLAGADTILKAAKSAPAEDESASAFWPSPDGSGPGSEDPRPLLVIPDSRGRVRCWHFLKTWPYWRGFVALCSKKTPQDYLDYLEKRNISCIVTGEDRVDLSAALEELNHRFGVKVVRADSGGKLNGALLRAGLADEVSLLIYPSLVGGETERSMFHAPNLASSEGTVSLKLKNIETLKDGAVWLLYDISKELQVSPIQNG